MARAPCVGRVTPRSATIGAEPLEGRVLLSAGDPDPSFGGGTGRVVTNFGAPAFGVKAAAVLGDGRLLVGGSVGGDLAVARYAADGTLDRAFGGGDGLATIDF